MDERAKVLILNLVELMRESQIGRASCRERV